MRTRLCPACRSPLSASVETYRYTESGLPHVVLEGVQVRRCSSCGHQDLVLPRVAELHRTIVGAVIDKPARLAGVEVRFLRSALGLSGRACARHVGVDPSTLSNWETGKEPIGTSSDRVLRLMAALALRVPYELERLTLIAPEVAPAVEVRVRPTTRGWRIVDPTREAVDELTREAQALGMYDERVSVEEAAELIKKTRKRS